MCLGGGVWKLLCRDGGKRIAWGRGSSRGIEWLEETMAFVIACMKRIGFIHFACENIELQLRHYVNRADILRSKRLRLHMYGLFKSAIRYWNKV